MIKAELKRQVSALTKRVKMLETALAEAKRRAGERDKFKAEAVKWEELARIDPLTMIANFREFDLRMEQFEKEVIHRGAKGVLVFVDLDEFKKTNDYLGHDIGDEVLREVASVVGHRIRSKDVWARKGGDEFVLLLRDVGIKIVKKQIIPKLRDGIRNIRVAKLPEEKLRLFLKTTGRQSLVAASFGFAEATRDFCKRHALIKKAADSVPKTKAKLL